MKNITILAVLAVSVSACSSMQTTDSKQAKIGLANPASQYCVDQGGKLEIVKEANGEVGYCHLPNGEKVEEWALFRQSQAQCVAEEVTKLVGQTGIKILPVCGGRDLEQQKHKMQNITHIIRIL